MHEFWIDVNSWQEADIIFVWCEERFGSYRYAPDPQEWKFYTNNRTICVIFFKDEDATVFTLTWGDRILPVDGSGHSF